MSLIINPDYASVIAAWNPGPGEQAGSASVYDRSHNNVTMDLTAGTGTIADKWVVSDGRYALDHGTADYFRVNPLPIDHVGDWTVGGWFRSTASTGGNQMIFNVRDQDIPPEIVVYLRGSDGRLLLLVTVGPAAIVHSATANMIADDTWHHFVLARSGTQYWLWLDGVVATSSPVTTDSYELSVWDFLGWGNQGTNSSNRMRGLLDDFAIFGEKLSDAAIVNWYTSGRGGLWRPCFADHGAEVVL